MSKSIQVSWSDLVFALSEALDLASPTLQSHQLRTAYIAWRLGEAAGLAPERLGTLFTAAAFHDIGALSPEEKRRLHSFEETDTAAHCILGGQLFRRMPRLAQGAGIVALHHTPWDQLDGDLAVPDHLDSQLLQAADQLERRIDRRTFILHQDQQLRAEIRALAGTWLHPEVVRLFLGVSERAEFWLDLVSPALAALLRKHGPLQEAPLSFEETLELSELFSLIIDFRSVFTATHTAGVTACAVALGALAGLDPDTLGLLRLAGNVHDIGKLVVDDAIREKAGPLTEAEYRIMQQHSYVTYHLLDSVRGLEQAKRIAAYHHERPDGSGYPFGIGGADLDVPCRVMAVADRFTALAEDRPYRASMDPGHLAAELSAMARRNHLDPGLVGLALANAGAIRQAMAASQARWAADYHHLVEV